jgi:hypothetical protein
LIVKIAHASSSAVVSDLTLNRFSRLDVLFAGSPRSVSTVIEESSRLIQALDLVAINSPSVKSEEFAARQVLSSLLEALDLAIEQTTDDLGGLSTEGGQAIAVIQQFIVTGELPAPGAYAADSLTALMIQELGEHWVDAPMAPYDTDVRDVCSIASSDGDIWHDAWSEIPSAHISDSRTAGSLPVRLQRVVEFVSNITQNDFTNGHARRAANVGNEILRNLASVGVATCVRQAVECGVGRALATGDASIEARMILGGIAGALPTMLNIAAIMRDNVSGTASHTTNISRSLNTVISVSALAVAGSTGSLASLAPTLVAHNVVYCGLREAIECVLRRSYEKTEGNPCVMAAQAAGSVFNGLLAKLVTRHATLLPEQDGVDQGWPSLNHLVRATVGVASETAGSFLQFALRHVVCCAPSSRESLRLKLEVGVPERLKAADVLMNTYATRSMATNNALLASSILGELVDKVEMSQKSATLMKDAIDAGIAFFNFFAVKGALQHQPRQERWSDVETGQDQGDSKPGKQQAL